MHYLIFGIKFIIIIIKGFQIKADSARSIHRSNSNVMLHECGVQCNGSIILLCLNSNFYAVL